MASTTKSGKSRIQQDAHEVLRTLVLEETEVRGEKNNWYLMRILLYRTAEKVIEWLVITFVDMEPMRDDSGDIIGISGVFTDIT